MADFQKFKKIEEADNMSSRTFIFSTAPFKVVNEATKRRINDELESMKTSINWNNLGSAKNIAEATREAVKGRDLGWEGTRAMMPNNYDFHHWMNYAHLLTVLYNRDHEIKRFSILRNAII